MDPPARKEKSKVKEPVSRVEKAKQKSAQQELKQRQRAEIHPSTSFLNRGGASFSQGYMRSCAPLLEPSNKLSRNELSSHEEKLKSIF
uniref:Small vasohibin-binding protein n=2 Tax=Canis lupus familiaris TaxID=9615 RepID=A0A8P0NU77_CANLF